MKTKIAPILMTLVMLPAMSFANAVDRYECDASLPQGTAEMKILWQAESAQIVIDFYNQVMNQIFPGSFHFSLKNYDPAKGDMAAAGAFYDGPEVIDATFQGNLKPNKNGTITVSLGAGWDHRIEYGYGNHLTCTLQ